MWSSVNLEKSWKLTFKWQFCSQVIANIEQKGLMSSALVFKVVAVQRMAMQCYALASLHVFFGIFIFSVSSWSFHMSGNMWKETEKKTLIGW